MYVYYVCYMTKKVKYDQCFRKIAIARFSDLYGKYKIRIKTTLSKS